MSRPYAGTAPRGASVTSGTVSAGTAITAGHIDINGVAFPAVAEVASAALRVDQLIALINSYFTLTGVRAEKITSTTYKLLSGAAITATLGATATVATFGFATSISDPLDGQQLLDDRKAFGSDAASSDSGYVDFGSQDITVKHARDLGLMERVLGADVEVTPAETPTRTDH